MPFLIPPTPNSLDATTISLSLYREEGYHPSLATGQKSALCLGRAHQAHAYYVHRFCRYPGRRRYLCSIYSFDRITSRDRHLRNCSTSKSCLAQGSADFHPSPQHLNIPLKSYPEQVTVRCQAITGGDNCSRHKSLPLIWWVLVLVETTLQHYGSCPPIKHQ